MRARRRRAALLLGLALILGALAASDVGRREAALRAQLGPPVNIVVARRPLAARRVVRSSDLALRPLPARYAPPGGTAYPEAVAGRRLAVPLPAGAAVTPELLERHPAAGPFVRKGERAADVVATGSPSAVVPGVRVDVLVTTEGGDGRPATARLALEDVEVLAAQPAPPGDDAARASPGPRVAATLRVRVRQAVYLAAAQVFAREIRLLARAPGDDERTGPVALTGSP